MYNVKFVIFGLILVLSLFACKQNDSPIESTPESNDVTIELDSVFVRFHKDFHMDSIFQLTKIQFPLENNANDDFEYWTVDNWIIHKPFQSFNNTFKRDFRVMGRIVTEKIVDINGIFTMERRFANLSGGWKLIYYSVETNNLKE